MDAASLPPHARKLSTPKRGYVASASKAKDQVTIGIHFSPEEFIHEALSLRHPTEQQSLFPKEVRENVAHLSIRTVHQVAIERTEQIRKWTAYAIETDKEERAAKSTLSHRIADVLKDKRLGPGLLDKLIKDSGHEDLTLVDDLTKGFDLTGALPRSGVFSQKFRPASMTCEDLRKVSELSRSVIIESLQSSGDPELDRGLFEATMKEVEKGFLEGPVCHSSFPPGSTLTKRFPVKQKNKVRPIDDYKASLVNFAVTQNEGVTIHTIDHIASMTACWMRSGNLNQGDPLVAKCWDLSDADKQVPLSDNAFELDSYLAVYDPSSKDAKIFNQRVLPFGSIASVTAFLRVSLAIWKIRSSLLKLIGRLQFASAQVFGRKLKRLLKVLSNHVTMGRKALSDLTKECLKQVSTILTCNSPRKVVASQSDILHIYVDASFNEADYSGIGGLIIDMHGDRLAFFSAKVEKEMVDAIVSKGQRAIIQELEMLAVLCAFKCWQEKATIHRIVLFTDSESVRGAFLKSWSANTDSDRLLNSIFEIESLFSLPVWIERVPSQSNPADVLSREVVTNFGNATKVEVDPWEMWNMSAE